MAYATNPSGSSSIKRPASPGFDVHVGFQHAPPPPSSSHPAHRPAGQQGPPPPVAAGGADKGGDELRVTMLGAGQEVGRSCCVLQYRGITVVCDSGVHPAFTGMAALPFIDEIDWSTVDALLITHFHLDHAAALTYIMEKTNFKDGRGKVYMTHPTKAVYRFLMQTEMLASWRSIQAVDFKQDIQVMGGLKFTSYHAGHVLGAAMFFIEMAGLKILYTGDYSREEDRHLVRAEVPPIRPDVLICESTYGDQTLTPRVTKEAMFTSAIHKIVARGGRVLMPVFALGRAQELLLILDEYWHNHPELHSVPVYYASSLAKKCMAVYQTYIHTMNASIQSRFARRDNPFVFRHVSNLRDFGRWEDKGPCVMLASPGMLQNGVSRELLERWAPDKKNGLIICGYSVEGTMARTIVNQPEEIERLQGGKIPLRMTVDSISFSAHVDFAANAQFIHEVKAQHLVLVHGEANNMGKLKKGLLHQAATRGEEIKIHMPRNCEVLKLQFRGERMAKAIGTLAATLPEPNTILSGLLVAKDFSYTLLDPSDLRDFTGLSTSSILQHQRVALGVGWDLVRWHLDGMYGAVVESVDDEGLKTFRIMDTVDVKLANEDELVLEWASSSTADMVADSTLALLLGVDTSPASVKMTTHPHSHDHSHAHDGHSHEHASTSDKNTEDSPELNDEQQAAQAHAMDAALRVERLLAFLDSHFGTEDGADGEDGEDEAAGEGGKDKVSGVEVRDPKDLGEDGQPKLPVIEVRVDEHIAIVEIDGLSVSCTHEPLKKRVESVISLALSTSTPLSATIATTTSTTDKSLSSLPPKIEVGGR
uniref:Endoribonuclease YSH1 n=1 Tax=Bartheletia paradoxa TaxID=669517 RepID=A0A2D0XKK1_9BASI|nr:hypothetical protein SPAR07089 [Bartheletia paradoxa]